jgi:hypothetical protein
LPGRDRFNTQSVSCRRFDARGKTVKLLLFWTALKTILSDDLGVAGALFILVAIIGFKEGALYSPIIGSGIGTWLLIRIWIAQERKTPSKFSSQPSVIHSILTRE